MIPVEHRCENRLGTVCNCWSMTMFNANYEHDPEE
jgi:hypothetical protein